MEKVKTSRNLKIHTTTTSDALNRQVPSRTVSNIRRGHLVPGMRDINRIEWELWEQQVSEYLRTVEKARLDHNNSFYNALERGNLIKEEVTADESSKLP